MMACLQQEDLRRHVAGLRILPKHVHEVFFLDAQRSLARLGKLGVFLEPAIENLTRHAEELCDGFGVVVLQGIALDPFPRVFRRILSWHWHQFISKKVAGSRRMAAPPRLPGLLSEPDTGRLVRCCLSSNGNTTPTDSEGLIDCFVGGTAAHDAA